MSEGVAIKAANSANPTVDQFLVQHASFPGGVEHAPRLFVRLVTFIPFVVGGFLLIAAGLKAHQLLTGDLPATDLFSSRWFRAALIDVEVLCGGALIIRVAPRVMRQGCQGLFAVFLAFSVFQMAFGAKSCACLGSLELGPMGMVALDIAVLGALWLWGQCDTIRGESRCAWGLALSIAVALISGSAWLAWAEPRPIVSVTPALIDLGPIPQGGLKQFAIMLRNNQNQTLVIERMASSCPCLSWAESSIVLQPFDSRLVDFELNLAKEPDFVGSLIIEATGTIYGQTRAFEVIVGVEVIGSRLSEQKPRHR
jgi:hypothetical protein